MLQHFPPVQSGAGQIPDHAGKPQSASCLAEKLVSELLRCERPSYGLIPLGQFTVCCLNNLLQRCLPQRRQVEQRGQLRLQRLACHFRIAPQLHTPGLHKSVSVIQDASCAVLQDTQGRAAVKWTSVVDACLCSTRFVCLDQHILMQCLSQFSGQQFFQLCQQADQIVLLR